MALRRASCALLTVLLLTACESGGFDPRAAFSSSSPQQKDDQAATLRLAEASLQSGDFATAISLFRSILAKTPDDTDVSLRLGNALIDSGAVHEGLSVIEPLAGRTPTAPVLTALGRVKLKAHQPKDAEQAFRSALEKDPADIAARNGLAVSLDFQRRHEEACEIYRALLAERPDNVAARSNLGLSLALQGRSAEAINTLLDVSAQPNSPTRSRHNLAVAYGLAGNIEAAEEIMRIDLNSTAVAGNRQFFSKTVAAPRPAVTASPLP